MTSKRHCEKYMTDTASPSRVEEIIDSINNGTVDATTVTLAEFMQVSFLELMYNDEQPLDVNQHMMYGGNLFNIHVCVAQINPNQPVTALKDMH